MSRLQLGNNFMFVDAGQLPTTDYHAPIYYNRIYSRYVLSVNELTNWNI